jgi:hypothetical protein
MLISQQDAIVTEFISQNLWKNIFGGKIMNKLKIHYILSYKIHFK